MNLWGTGSVAQDIGNFLEGYWGAKPIFSGGVQIGNWEWGGSLLNYFDTSAQSGLAPLCNQQIQLWDTVTAAQQDPSTWMTYDDNEQLISVQDYCLQKAVIPNWVTQDVLNQYVQNPDGSITKPGAAAAFPIVPLAVAGGLVLLSILLIARR